MVEPLVLRTALGKHDHVRPLRDGRVTSERITLDFVEFDPLPKAFRTMAREGALDVSEMALVTHFLAHSFGKRITAIAIPLWSRLPHANLVCAQWSDVKGPADLKARIVGVRSYAQTSGVWVRGILRTEYGLDLDTVVWGTMEDAHLTEYVDPPNTRRYSSPPSLRDRMTNGDFAAIMGERIVEPAGIRTIIPDAEAAAHDWIQSTGIHPVNHVLAVKTELIATHPWLPGELMDLFKRAKELAVAEGAAAPPEYGLEPLRASLNLCMQFTAAQKVTVRAYPLEDMFCNV